MKKSKTFIPKILIAALALFLLLNRGARTIVGNLIHQKKLKAGIEEISAQNVLLKNEIFNLQNNPAYLIRIVKNEYKVIADNEIEYRLILPNEKK